MNNKSLVKLSNIIGIVSIILLIYWVFIFISVTVFELKIFRGDLEDIFFSILLGISTLIVGALLVNIMFNLTRIAEKHNNDGASISKKVSKKWVIAFILSFPLIFGLLYGGDYLRIKKEEKSFIASTQSVVETYGMKFDNIVNYSFGEEWILDVANTLGFFYNIDVYCSNMTVIVPDIVEDMPVFLEFERYYPSTCSDTVSPMKKDYILKTTKAERDYLNGVFFHKKEAIRYDKTRYQQELFYPYSKNGKIIVIYFSDNNYE